MLKKNWLIPVALIILTLAVTAWTLAVFIHSPPPATSILHIDCHTPQSRSSPIANRCPYKILVFSKTGAFRHASIKDGKLALQKLATEHTFAIDFSEDAN